MFRYSVDCAVVQYLELNLQPLPFHTWLYCIVVTICTVGYGDITPISTLGRFAIMGIIFFAIVYVPMQTNKLIEMMNAQSIYARAKYKPRGIAKHVIICGDLRSTSLIDFFNELFHEDHENYNLNAVVLQPDPPSFDMMRILQHHVYSLCVHFIEGSPLLDVDLARVRAESALAIFMLGNKFCADADAEDTKSILQQFSIKRYMISNGAAAAKDALFCIQLLRSENRKHLGESEDSDKQLVLCLNEMKMGALAKACMFPGTSTLIFNLLSSFADDDEDDFLQDKDGVDAVEDDDIGTWLEEYQKGCGWEIYVTELSAEYTGKKFSSVAHEVYFSSKHRGVVLFALKISDKKGRSPTRVVLNPADFIIPSRDDYDIEGFVIAGNKNQSNLSDSTPESEHYNTSSNDMSSNSKENVEVNSVVRRMSKDRNNSSFRWQDVKVEYENGRSELVNNQELLSKNEDEHLKANYFIRGITMSQERCTVETNIIDEVPTVNQHIIIIGKTLGNVYDFIRAWRAKYLGRLKHMVILSPEKISEAIWRRIARFEGVRLIKGSGLEESDLKRAGIFRAAQVVVLAGSTVNNESKRTAAMSSADTLQDSDAIFTYQLVRKLNDKAHVVVEIVHSSNVGYLDSGSTLVSADDYKFTPQFASGTLYTSSLMDTILCQVRFLLIQTIINANTT